LSAGAWLLVIGATAGVFIAAYITVYNNGFEDGRDAYASGGVRCVRYGTSFGDHRKQSCCSRLSLIESEIEQLRKRNGELETKLDEARAEKARATLQPVGKTWPVCVACGAACDSPQLVQSAHFRAFVLEFSCRCGGPAHYRLPKTPIDPAGAS
jgi:hypothetical protein